VVAVGCRFYCSARLFHPVAVILFVVYLALKDSSMKDPHFSEIEILSMSQELADYLH
jgi:hypothetical protein